MMRKLYILSVILLFAVIKLSGQNQTNFWHFGVLTGLDFSSGTPVVLSNSAINTNEASASISDAAGNLLFYTDGVSVWNRNNAQMPNGFGLLGDPSTTQVIIVPAPGSVSRYYIFTLDDEDGPFGLNYSTVDMSLDGGLGDVSEKNTHLKDNVTEKIAAVYHCNNHDIWVMVHSQDTDEFDAFLVTDAGVSATPVVSAAGIAHTDVHGQMKFSSDGKKIACAIAFQDLAEVLEFNNVTGTVSSPTSIPLGNRAYGLEFSPDNSKLYVSYYTDESYISQFDLTAADIAASQFVVTISPDVIIRSLQLGPDGKIYAAKSITPFLSVINNPDLAGAACNYQDNAVDLDPLFMGSMCMLGLPGFVQSFLNPLFPNVPCGNLDAEFASSDTILCVNQCIEFNYSGTPATTWNWNFQGASPAVSTDENPQNICYSTPGNYTVTLIVTSGELADTLEQTITVSIPPEIDAGIDVTIEPGQSTQLNATGNVLGYLWSPEVGLSDPTVQDPIATPATTTTYFVSGADASECGVMDSVKVTVAAIEPGIDCGDVFVPTAFSPDNNGENDFECVAGKCIASMRFTIFNRWGDVVFETESPEGCWDGTYKGQLLNTAEFVYHLEATLVTGEQITRTGTVSLIR